MSASQPVIASHPPSAEVLQFLVDNLIQQVVTSTPANGEDLSPEAKSGLEIRWHPVAVSYIGWRSYNEGQVVGGSLHNVGKTIINHPPNHHK